jgi:SynChlorMet cassette protein ScmC
MIDLITYPYSKGYCLNLSDGNNWWVTGYKDGIEYSARFANILRLKECSPNNSPKLIFSAHQETEKESHSFDISAPESNTGWRFCENDVVSMWYHNDFDDVICEFKNNSMRENLQYLAMWLSLQPIFHRSVKMGGLPFHSALAECNGKGVLFVAHGGRGKSTCCRRLPSHWKPLCDDETLVVLDKDNRYRAHSFPTWSDYLNNRAENSWDVQYSVPVSAIFLIQQAESDRIAELSKLNIPFCLSVSANHVLGRYPQYIQQMTQKEQNEVKEHIFNNAFDITKSIPILQLRVSLNGRFWEEIEKILGL